MISISDFKNWQSDPVTQAFYNACEERITEMKDLLSTSAGIDSIQDNFYRGFIYAYNEIKDFRVEDTQ